MKLTNAILKANIRTWVKEQCMTTSLSPRTTSSTTLQTSWNSY